MTWDWFSFLLGLGAGTALMWVGILVGLLMGGAAKQRDRRG
jgi:hypothetical protein